MPRLSSEARQQWSRFPAVTDQIIRLGTLVDVYQETIIQHFSRASQELYSRNDEILAKQTTLCTIPASGIHRSCLVSNSHVDMISLCTHFVCSRFAWNPARADALDYAPLL